MVGEAGFFSAVTGVTVVSADPQVLCIPGWGAKAGWKSDTIRTLQTSLNALLQPRFAVGAFPWDRDGGFPEAQFAAGMAGRDLHKWISERETEKVAYHLVAYSLGAKVVVAALEEEKDAILQHCRGVYFLGAAIPCDGRLNQGPLREVKVCCNFYSRWFDWALAVSYKFTQFECADGSVGLQRTQKFRNIACDRTHCWFGSRWSWAGMAPRVAQLIRASS
jgi:hypothetical protein